MLDSLDLTDLQRQVEEAKKADTDFYPFLWNIMIGLGLVFLIALMGIFFVDGDSLLKSFGTLYALICPFIFIAIATTVFLYRVYQRNLASRRRANQYKPSFVPQLAMTIEWRNYLIWVITIFIIGVVFRLYFLIILGLILAPLMPYVVILIVINWLQRGSHEKRLSRTEMMLQRFPNDTNLLNVRILCLATAGYLVEAEEICRQLLSSERYVKTSFNVSYYLNYLGGILALEGRSDEAIPLLESSIRITPEYGAPYLSLAEIYIEQDIEYQRALQLIEIAMTYNHTMSMPLAVPYVVKARVLALIGQTIPANEALNEALQSVKNLPSSSAAEVYRQAGFTRRAQGDEVAARELFTKAVAVDPDGLFGKLAQRALDTAL